MKQTTAPAVLEAVALRQAAATYRAVNHPLRLSVLRLLDKQGRMAVTALYRKLRIQQSVASLQLAVLRRAGLVIAEREGQQVFYRVNYPRLARVQKAAQKIVTAFEKR